MPHEHGRRNGIPISSLPSRGCRGKKPDGGRTKRLLEPPDWLLEDEVGTPTPYAWRSVSRIELTRVSRYLKLGFGGAHTDSNQRLMYTSA